MFKKISAGLVGGVLLAVLVPLIVNFFGTSGQELSIVYSVSALFFGFALALTANSSGIAWRRVLLVSGVLCIALPLVAVLNVGTEIIDSEMVIGESYDYAISSPLLALILVLMGAAFLYVAVRISRTLSNPV